MAFFQENMKEKLSMALSTFQKKLHKLGLLISISPNYKNLFSNVYGISSCFGFLRFSTYWFRLFLKTKSTVLSKYFVFVFY